MPSTHSASRDHVIGVYTSVFLKPEDAWVYEAVSRIDAMEIHVFYDTLQDISYYPFQNIHCVLPAEPDLPPVSFASLWPFSRKASVAKRPTGPGVLLAEEIAFWGVEVLHVLSGVVALNFMPVFQALKLPLVTSFDDSVLGAVSSQMSHNKDQAVWDPFLRVGCRSSSVLHGLKDLGCPSDKLYPLYPVEPHQTASMCLEAFYRQLLVEI